MAILDRLKPGDICRDLKSKRRYRVLLLANLSSKHPDYPVTVVYADVQQLELVFCDKLANFVVKFERAP